MRRRAFHGSLLMLLAAGGWLAGAPARAAHRVRRGAAPDLFFYLPDRPAVLALGRRCLAKGVPAAESGFERDVHEAVVADFAAGRVVRVEGWLISWSEARIAAALATGR